ncbi:Unknown protein, partial [Striga hermonthica]
KYIYKEDDNPTWVVLVYLSTVKAERESQWQILIEEKAKWGDKWFAAGDWNDICHGEEKKGGRPRLEESCRGFREFINAMGMQEISQRGQLYTWGNNREGEGFVEEKLDRTFATLEWINMHPSAQTTCWFRSSSDHCMLVIEMDKSVQKQKKRFMFDKRWISREGVSDVVQKAWEGQGSGTPMLDVKEKVKKAREALLIWSKYFRTENADKIKTLTLSLEEMRQE